MAASAPSTTIPDSPEPRRGAGTTDTTAFRETSSRPTFMFVMLSVSRKSRIYEFPGTKPETAKLYAM
jgi:hypothetical protein